MATKTAKDFLSSLATAPDTMKALPVLSLSVLPVLSVSALPVFVLVLLWFQILSWLPAQSASLRWSLVPSTPPWWALVPSVPPWRASASSVPPWWASALLWWAPGHSPISGGLQSDLALHSAPCSASAPPPSWIVMLASGSRSLGRGYVMIWSRIIHPSTTRGHPFIIWTWALHRLLHHTDYISHQSQHYTITWFQSQLLPISITPAPHLLLYISSLHTRTHCEVLFLPRLTFLSVSPFFWLWLMCLTPDCLGTLKLCLWPRLLPGIVYISALPLIFLFLLADFDSV